MRHGGRIEPSLDLRRYDIGGGWIVVTKDALSISLISGQDARGLPDGHGSEHSTTIMLDPSMAPLFRMIAKRLDSIKWDDDDR